MSYATRFLFAATALPLLSVAVAAQPPQLVRKSVYGFSFSLPEHWELCAMTGEGRNHRKKLVAKYPGIKSTFDRLAKAHVHYLAFDTRSLDSAWVDTMNVVRTHAPRLRNKVRRRSVLKKISATTVGILKKRGLTVERVELLPFGRRLPAYRIDATRKTPGGAKLFMRQFNVFHHPFQWSFTWTTLADRVEPPFETWIEKAARSFRPPKRK